MRPPTRFVLLVGSPKGNGGTSLQLGRYIMDRLPSDGTEKAIHHLGKAIRKDEMWAEVMASVEAADTIILSFPLYWDATPSHVTRTMELLAVHRRRKPVDRQQTLVAMVNNGFPEPWHNEVALRICHRFAEEAGFTWGGGLNVGGGGAIGERPLEETGGMTARLRAALDKAAGNLARGEPIGTDVVTQLYPTWIIKLMGFIGWRRRAKREGAVGPLKARPYE